MIKVSDVRIDWQLTSDIRALNLKWGLTLRPLVWWWNCYELTTTFTEETFVMKSIYWCDDVNVLDSLEDQGVYV